MKNLIPHFIAEKFENNESSGSFKGSVLSLDLKGFTKMTGELMKEGKYGAEILSDIINMVFAPTVEIIRQKGGFVSAFVGDAITAVFPEVYAQQSVGAADDILSLISKMKSTKIGNYSFGIEARIGLAYGDIEWQIINSERRSVYYFKGETFYSAADSQQSADTGTCKFDKSIEKLQIPNKQPRDIRHKDIKSSVIRNFAPDQVITMKTSGEFRDIVSVFIMFREDQTDLKELSGFLCEKPMDHGGYLNKIDFGDKGGIALIIFGAPVAVEKYPERAVAFTLELIRAFPKVRAGISKGTAYCGFIGSKERCEYTAMGEVVNLSARIATKCGAGDILLDEKTAAYGFTAFSVTEKTSFKLKGFTKKIRVFSPEHKTETNLSSGNKFFVGRKNEFDRILKISDKAFRKGRSVVIQVNGDPGIGKSSLISAVRGYMEKTGVKWFYLQCDEILKKSLNPFSYFFKNYFGINDYNSEEESCALLRSGLTDFKNLPNYSAIEYFIGRLVGIKIENSVFDGLEIRESYENILYSVRTFFLKQAENSPVIIEIDDIHNIDESSKEALQAILRKTGDLPVVIVTSARFNSNGSIYKLESIDAETEYFSLTSLDKDSVRSLAENIYGTAISESLLDLLLHKGSGNPFYTEQMVLYLKESGKIEIPDRISSVIISRIDKLSSELKKLIRTASVLGKEFSVRLLAEVLKKKDISSQIGKAEQEAIWNKTTEIFYIFRHAILRDTVYEMQLKKTLKELHLLTAKTIENLYYQELSKHYADLAYHFEKAESFEDTKKYLNLAGYNSAENYRNAEAIGYYIKLYDYCRTEEEQAETYRNIGELYIRLGDWKNTESYFKKSYRKAIRYGSQLQIVKSGISLAEYYGEIGDFKKNIRLVKKMLAIAEKQKFSDQMNMIYLNLGVIYRLMSENDKSEKYYLKALKYYRLRKNHTMIRTIYDNLGVLYMSAGEFSKAKYYYRLAERRSVKENDSFGLMNIYNNMGMIYYYQGELEKALDLFGKSLELADKLGILRHKSIVYGQFAQIYFYKNECETALDYSLKGFEISEEMGDSFNQCYLLSSIGVLYRKLGRPDKAMESFEKQAVISHKLGLKELISLSLDNIGFMHSLMGNFIESNEMYEKAIKINTETENKISLAVNYANTGENYKYLKDYKKSLELYHKAIEINEELDLKFQLVSCYCYISEVYAESGNKENALKFLEKCKTLSKELGRNDYYFKAEVLENLMDRTKLEKERTAHLIKLDSDELNEEDKASLYKAVYTLSRDKTYKNKALEIYTGLYEKLKYYEYKKAMEELG